MKFINSAILVLLLYVKFSTSQEPIVATPYGEVMGKYTESYGGKIVIAFEGIPYAQPPIKSLRFQEPKPLESWEGTLIANKTYTCMQYSNIILKGILGQEDCLYLYIYVPRKEIIGNEKLDVIVHIHGGAFMIGSPKFLAGPDYIMDEDVIYVSFNYRLGILGFLSTEDEIMPGNNGLKDQTLALKWIKKNIKYFGGNPYSITLTGLSAGASSVHYHYLSPLSKGLFHKGISQSGTALSHWALEKNALKNAKDLAGHLNCPKSSSSEIMKCLATKSSKDILRMLPKFAQFMDIIPICPFGPVVEQPTETAFLPYHPYKLLAEKQLANNDIPWIASVTKDEGIFPIGFLMSEKLFKEVSEKWNELAPLLLNYIDTACEEDKMKIAEKVREFYFKNETFSMENVYKTVELFTDRYFKVDIEKSVRLHAKASQSAVYMYQYEYSPKAPSLIKGKLEGSSHGDDGRMWLKVFGSPQKFSEDDEEMKNFLMEMIISFARTGIPHINGTKWIPISSKPGLDILHIANATTVDMSEDTDFARSDFWEDLPIFENKFNVEGTLGPACSGTLKSTCDSNFFTFILCIYVLKCILSV